MAAPKIRELVQPIETDDGDRVIPGTRRPDGTVRKERRVRPGYTPQEEQPVYQSKGALVRQNVPVCPGLDPSVLASSAGQQKSQAAKKNEKRREKKVGDSGQGASASPTPTPTQPSTRTPAPASAPKPTAAPTAPPAVSAVTQPEDPKVAAEKALRNLRKKVRQAEGLVEKQKTGESLSAEETDKASKLAAWLKEVEDLEKQIAAL